MTRILQVPASRVQARQTRRIRDSKIDIGWFASQSDYPIEHPPELAKDSLLELNDIFLHSWRTKHQAWRCTALRPIVWTPLVETETIVVPGDHRLRQFVITNNGKPSYIVPNSLARRYRDKADAITNTTS